MTLPATRPSILVWSPPILWTARDLPHFFIEEILQYWPSRPGERRMWFRAAQAIALHPGRRHAFDVPALLPGLVRVRLGAALLLAGMSANRTSGHRLLMLGSHAGLEVRMLLDAGWDAFGVERRGDLVRIALETGMVSPGRLQWDDMLHALDQSPEAAWSRILALAPESVDLRALRHKAARCLRPGGRLVVLAYWADLPERRRPMAVPAVEGTMGGLVGFRLRPPAGFGRRIYRMRTPDSLGSRRSHATRRRPCGGVRQNGVG